MQTILNKTKLYITAHKVMSVVILIVAVLVIYFGYKKITSTSGDTRYVTTKVSRGTIIATVSGSGQVSASNQIDIKPKVSGDVVYVAVQNGQKVNTGTLIAQLDIKDAEKVVRDAQINLDSAKISLAQLKVTKSTGNTNADLVNSYDNGFNTVASTFLDLPGTIDGLETIFSQDNLSDNAARVNGNVALDLRNAAETSYYSAKNALDENKKFYNTLTYNSSQADLDKIINETYETTKLFSDAIKNLRGFVDFMAENTGKNSPYVSTQNTLSTYANTINGHLSSLLASQTNIKNNKDAFTNSDLDIQSAELGIQQKENALQDAKDNLADYYIRAPFNGTIAVVNVKNADSVSTGTAVATIITEKQLAEISLNEVDVAKINTGQKATLTFDAIPNLTISGQVESIDTIGAVSQGVVTYIVKISFDTQDTRVKPSMSVSASIITNIKQDVLTAPNSAIKSQNGANYVEIFNTPLAAPTDGLLGSISLNPPQKQSVEVGFSNDSTTEIVSGLKEGDEIVSRTILPSTATTSTAPSIFGSPANRGGGGAIRVQTPGATGR